MFTSSALGIVGYTAGVYAVINLIVVLILHSFDKTFFGRNSFAVSLLSAVVNASIGFAVSFLLVKYALANSINGSSNPLLMTVLATTIVQMVINSVFLDLFHYKYKAMTMILGNLAVFVSATNLAYYSLVQFNK